MRRYAMDDMPGVLVTASDVGDTWNGFGVPHATYTEMAAYSRALQAAGHAYVFRPVLTPTRDGFRITLRFPCVDVCDRADAVSLPDGEHFHRDESTGYDTPAPDAPVFMHGLTWYDVDDAGACVVCGSFDVAATVYQDGEPVRVCEAHRGEHRAAVCYVCGAGPVVDWVCEDANDARAEFLPVCEAHPWGDE